uniref:Carboxylesterase type B domain-containing protein n=1 Tax=Bracon brevicornis TaxID=1563983 RepID=A0A6V7IAC1_9HYME
MNTNPPISDSKDISMNEDKQEIADEEREKMLNQENEKHNASEVAIVGAVSTAAADDSPSSEPRKIKIPIGGIKMPGFCRTTRSREINSKDEVNNKQSNDGAVGCSDAEVGILDAMKRPLVHVLYSIRRNKLEGELAGSGVATAGLASVETLGDIGDKGHDGVDEAAMETIKLDDDSGQNEDDNGKLSRARAVLMNFVSIMRDNRFVTATILTVLLAIIVIISIACAGPRRLLVQPLKDGKYMEAVTGCGPVQGILEDGGFAFRGIPYALPPVDDLRWRPAKPIEIIEHCWNGTYLAHNSSNSCYQRSTVGDISGDEDCLYLDIFTPQVRYDTPLPVVVMIGAESLSGGSPGVMQPSAKLARVRDMVFVRPNFRLGIFGFLATKPLTKTNEFLTSGNYGLSDVILALKWVQLNIQNFGGDKNSVTIWGHRAGGTIVTALLAASDLKNKSLFSRAWISSPSVVLPVRSLDIDERLTEPFLNAINCNDARCLRSKSPMEIMQSVPEHWYNIPDNDGLPISHKSPQSAPNKHQWLVVDGIIIKDNIYETLKQQGLLVKTVMGTTAHSAMPTDFINSTINNDTQIERIIKESLLGNLGVSDEAIKLYNLTHKIEALASMISDIRVICPIYNLTNNIIPQNNVSFYVATQPRHGHLADIDSDVAAILGLYTLKTPEEKRHQSAIQQLFNQFVWHNRIIDPANDSLNSYGITNNKTGRKTIIVGQDILLQYGYSHCDYWIQHNFVPNYARVD